MQVIISTRGMTVSRTYKDELTRKLAKLEPLLPALVETRAVLSKEKHRRTAALTLVARRRAFRSRETAPDLEAAVGPGRPRAAPPGARDEGAAAAAPRPPAIVTEPTAAEPLRFVIITGLSGAGKSYAIKCLEDLNYFCVDNLPTTLIPTFAELCAQSSRGISAIALGVDVREGEYLAHLVGTLEELRARGHRSTSSSWRRRTSRWCGATTRPGAAIRSRARATCSTASGPSGRPWPISGRSPTASSTRPP